ncbi:phosphoribosylanthranilate isomerase [Coraliomargarita algicola]|uniref:N-(5'-phosphoribosyl)anthranilate isomerase n=1 Tax=Coraliomargarita algicola TaxID=3092156 RepID=A0ABZ0RMR3_9BACT|nr:phosphoribosylanthranilate isomerase [Coraliomargarita sp. J2-16]WPJ96441.1 phosphoribosylanthranilate isomerase [Coraliomargarita sp. J2-16]
MSRTLKIKICGLTREEDVDQALSLGADFCGFILYPKSPRALSLERATELVSRVPAGKRVMVDVATDCQALERYRDAGFDYFQIHCSPETDAATLEAWSQLVGRDRLWLAPRLAPNDVFPIAMMEYADTLLIDTFSKDQVGGTGKVGDWARFNRLKSAHPQIHWVLAGGLSPDNVRLAVTSTTAQHLDINSGVETQPGIKDPAKLREVFRLLR